VADRPAVGVPRAQRRWFAVLLGQGSEFAFVVFGAAQMADVLDGEWAKALTLAVALSMAATPILLVLLTRLEKSPAARREADEIDEEQPRVIIAGFGRYGQIAGRVLLSSGVKMVILDHDPDHVDTLRKFDMKVFYGDATRVDLLESAGAEKAEVLINAIDDPQTACSWWSWQKSISRICRLSPAPAMSIIISSCARLASKRRSVKPSKRR
jgi:glutathione-regulated potassium-efflux system ancillary protein KefC